MVEEMAHNSELSIDGRYPVEGVHMKYLYASAGLGQGHEATLTDGEEKLPVEPTWTLQITDIECEA